MLLFQLRNYYCQLLLQCSMPVGYTAEFSHVITVLNYMHMSHVQCSVH